MSSRPVVSYPLPARDPARDPPGRLGPSNNKSAHNKSSSSAKALLVYHRRATPTFTFQKARPERTPCANSVSALSVEFTLLSVEALKCRRSARKPHLPSKPMMPPPMFQPNLAPLAFAVSIELTSTRLVGSSVKIVERNWMAPTPLETYGQNRLSEPIGTPTIPLAM